MPAYTFLMHPRLALPPSLPTQPSTKGRSFTAPHEVHQYEQTKFVDEPEWEYSFDVPIITFVLRLHFDN